MKKQYDYVELLNKLVEKGKKTGELSLTDVSKVVDKLNISEERLEIFYKDLFFKCSEANIKIVENNNEEDDYEIYDNVNYDETNSQYLDDGIMSYLHEMGKIPLLSPEEEKELTIKLAEGTEEEAAKAKKKLIEANLRLVVSIAKYYARKMNVPLMDVVQDGNMGLIKAIEKFDYRLGFKLSTYAVWWIRQSIIRNGTDTGRSIRLPVGVNEKLNKFRKATAKLSTEKGRQPSAEELAKYMKLPVTEVRNLALYDQDIISLYIPIGDNDEGDYLMDFVADESTKNTQDNTLRQIMVRDILDDAKSYLTENELIVITRRYGLITGDNETLDQIAKTIGNGITRERVRQIEKSALRKIRKNMKAKYLKHEEGD